MTDLIAVNLLPAEYRLRKRAIRIQRSMLYPILAAILSASIIWVITLNIDNQIASSKSDIAMLETQIEQNRHVEDEIRALNSDKRIIVEKIMALERINVNRSRWVRLLEVFCEKMPEYTWVINLSEADSSSNTLSLEGRTYSFTEVATYMSSLKETPYITNVDLVSIEQIDVVKRLFAFKLVCTVDPNAGLTETAGTESAGRR